MEGQELRASFKLWHNIAASECRLELMRELGKLKVGFGDLEKFNLGIISKLRSKTMRERGEEITEKIINSAMSVKLRDEERFREEMERERNCLRRLIANRIGKNSKPYRKLMRELRNEAYKVKEEYENEHKEKVQHLKRKFREEESEKLDKVPENLNDYKELSIFNKEKFENIEVREDEILVISEGIELSEDEKALLRLHTKFSVVQKLEETGFEFEQELAYAKIRLERRNDLERESKLAEENLREKVIELREQEKKKGEIEYERDLEDPPLLEIPEEFPRPRREKKEKEKRREDEKARKEKEEEDEREEELREEEEARTRQVFNPIKKIFDERKRRVTDLPECGRVTLPKPLIVSEEALIEIRREIHSRTYRDYRAEFTIDGEQKSNMEENEIRGLRSLLKRIRAGELLIIKTDKSGKFCIVSVQDYLKLGEVHTKQDKKITRETVVKTEKLLNSHSTAWCKIWSSGENHGHSDRIMSSKISSSENKATLYPLYKDHKSVPGKTRPVVTGCSSDTRGLSNSVSSFLESVANCNTDNFESISGEDMLSKTKEYNANIKLIRSKWEKRRTAKLSKKCGKCCIIVMVEECANKKGEHYHSHTDKNNKNIVIEDQEEQERTDKKAITVGERISCISGTIVDAEKEKEE